MEQIWLLNIVWLLVLANLILVVNLILGFVTLQRIGLPIYKVVTRNYTDKNYVFDDKVPYEYDASSLRETPAEFKTDFLFIAFVTQFKLGMSDYVLRDYESTIRLLQELEPTVLMLQVKPNNEKLLPWIRDFYFYLGISHFALSRSQRRDLGKESRRAHTEHSIRWLALADSLVMAKNLEGSDRETYFLGLTYGLGGQKTAAVDKLRNIQPQSRFYHESVKLVQKWLKQ